MSQLGETAVKRITNVLLNKQTNNKVPLVILDGVAPLITDPPPTSSTTLLKFL